MMVNNNLVGGKATPLKNMISSLGMMTTFPIYGKKQFHVPNHQSASLEILNVITSPSTISHHGTIGGLYYLYPITIG